MRASKYERRTFWVAVLALVVPVILYWLARQDNVQLAGDTGQLRKPHLMVRLSSFEMNAAARTDLLFGAPAINEPKAVLIGAVPIVLTNSGDRTLDDLIVTFRYNKIFRRKGLEAMEPKVIGSAQASSVKHTFNADDQFEHSSYQLPALNPKVSFGVEEPIALVPTSTNVEVPFETLDKQHGTATVHVEYSLQFLLSITARDTAEANYTVNVSTAASDSLDHLTDIAKQSRIGLRIQNARKSATFAQYLRGLLFGVPEERLYLIFPEFESWQVEDGRLYHARPDPKVRELSYTPVSWRYLF